MSKEVSVGLGEVGSGLMGQKVERGGDLSAGEGLWSARAAVAALDTLGWLHVVLLAPRGLGRGACAAGEEGERAGRGRMRAFLAWRVWLLPHRHTFLGRWHNL